MSYSGELVPILRDLDAEELDRIEQFSRRYRELWRNFEDMREMGFDPSGSYTASGVKISRAGNGVGVSEFRLKSFFTDYRHFSGREPANFHSMCRLIQKVCRDPRLAGLIAREQEMWASAGVLAGWHNNFSADDVIDAMDKEEVFHTERKGKGDYVRLSDVKARLEDKALWAEVSIIVYHRMCAIRNIHYFIQPLLSGERAVQLPKSR